MLLAYVHSTQVLHIHQPKYILVRARSGWLICYFIDSQVRRFIGACLLFFELLINFKA